MITKLKSVTAKLLANTFNRPIILVDTAYDGIDGFLASLNFECVLFFDEFEKNFDPKKDVNILTIMDGVYNCCERKVFILTTNELRINSCLLSRPSRIRYKKEFTNVSIEVINYFLDTLLKDQSARKEIFNFITTLEVCSVDIIKSVINEVNIHGVEEFAYIKEIFNVKTSEVFYDIITASSNYFNYDTGEYEQRSKADCLNLINEYSVLVKKLNKTPEELDRFNTLRQLGVCNSYSILFPCRLWDLKVGMLVDGEPVIEVMEDSRIVVTRDSNNNFTYTYVVPTYTYNAYQGNLLVLRF